MHTADRAIAPPAVVRGPLVEHDCDATLGDSGPPLLAGSGEDVRVAVLHMGYSGRGTDHQGTDDGRRGIRAGVLCAHGP